MAIGLGIELNLFGTQTYIVDYIINSINTHENDIENIALLKYQ